MSMFVTKALKWHRRNGDVVVSEPSMKLQKPSRKARKVRQVDATSSIDHAQRVGHLGTPEEWREVCRTYRCRMNAYDIQQMAKLRTYIEEGLLVVVRPGGVRVDVPAQPQERVPCSGCTSEIYCEMNGCKRPRTSGVMGTDGGKSNG